MVRVISEKLFSPPRSRHSSGETVDKELAARAVEALPSFANSRRFELSSDYESSSDSHWDSEVDLEGDGPYTPGSETGPATGEEGERSTDVVRKRRERRRERNKLSAQAYRMRRRELSVKQQSVLVTLQEENTRLKTQVQELEDEISKFRDAVKTSLPDPMLPSSSSFDCAPPGATTTTTTSSVASLPSTSFPLAPGPFPRPQLVSGCRAELGQELGAENGNRPAPAATFSSGFGVPPASASPFFASHPASSPAAGPVSFGSSSAQSEPPVTFDMLAQQGETSRRPQQQQQQQKPRRRQPSQSSAALDNARSLCQYQISPAVDNFSFASGGALLRRPAPVDSPCSSVGSGLSNPTTPTPTPTGPTSPGPAFVFPPTAAAATTTTHQPLLVPRVPLVGAAYDAGQAVSTATEEELLNRRYIMLQQQHKPSGTLLHPPHGRQADLNANSDEIRNSNIKVVMGNSNHQHHQQQPHPAQPCSPHGHGHGHRPLQPLTGAGPRYGLTQAAHHGNGNEIVRGGQPATFAHCRNDNAFGPVSNRSNSSSNNNNNNNNVSFAALASAHFSTAPTPSAVSLGAAPLQMFASQPLPFKVTQA